MIIAALLSCTGTQATTDTTVGPLQVDPPPKPPTDLQQIDMTKAIEDALHLGGGTTLAAAWNGHINTVLGAPIDCPQIFLGPPPDSVLGNTEINMDDENPGYSWAAACITPDNVDYEGFTYWTTLLTPGAGGERTLDADATVVAGSGDNADTRFAFTGSANDNLNVVDGTYDSTINGRLSGSLVGLGSGVQTGGDFVTTITSDGTLSITGSVTTFDGFGKPDNRDPGAPELQDVPSWKHGMPRFTSATFDLQFTPDCPQEPLGYVGLRGDEGFWFDVYFLPQYDDSGAPSAQVDAFPFEEIDNQACDGVGTVFARNVDLKGWDDCDPDVVGDNDCISSWSREIAPDFAGVVSQLSLPSIDSFVYNVRDIPQE